MDVTLLSFFPLSLSSSVCVFVVVVFLFFLFFLSVFQCLFIVGDLDLRQCSWSLIFV